MDKHDQEVDARVNGLDDQLPKKRKAADDERTEMRRKQQDDDPEPLRDKELPRKI